VYGGHSIIAENGHIFSEGTRFSRQESMITADVDTDFIIRERINNKTFSDCTSIELARSPGGGSYRLVNIEEDISGAQRKGLNRNGTLTPENLLRYVDDRPFVPSVEGLREARCREIFSIQSAGLASRLHHIGCSDVVVGLSGGKH
jgi:NAD+ synthase (glutamine-hydrolysing)